MQANAEGARLQSLGASALGADPYKVARTLNTLDAVASGDPERMARRLRNVLVGRAAARAGFFRASKSATDELLRRTS